MATHTAGHPRRAGRALRQAGTVGALVIALAAVVAANAPRQAAPPSAPVATVTTATADAAYLEAVRPVVSGTRLDSLADDDLIGLAVSFCDGITNGATRADFVKSASLMEVPLRTYRSVLVLAEGTYCPEHIGFRI